MADEGVLRQKARDAIQAGELPNRPPDRLWGGPATGARCAICGKTTTEHEFEFAYEGHDGSQSHFAHSRCWHAFEAEVRPACSNGVGQGRALGATHAGDSVHADGE